MHESLRINSIRITKKKDIYNIKQQHVISQTINNKYQQHKSSIYEQGFSTYPKPECPNLKASVKGENVQLLAETQHAEFGFICLCGGPHRQTCTSPKFITKLSYDLQQHISTCS